MRADDARTKWTMRSDGGSSFHATRRQQVASVALVFRSVSTSECYNLFTAQGASTKFSTILNAKKKKYDPGNMLFIFLFCLWLCKQHICIGYLTVVLVHIQRDKTEVYAPYESQKEAASHSV